MSWWSKYSLSQMEEMMDFLFQQSQGGGSSASLIHQASRTFTNDEIKALPTVLPQPVFVPAPGAGRILWFFGGRSLLDVTNGVYTNVHADTIAPLSIGSTDASTAVDLLFEMLTDNSAVWTVDYLPAVYNSDFLGCGIAPFMTWIGTVDVEDKPLRFTLSNGLGNYQDGHADNTWKFGLQFGVFDMATLRLLTTTESGWDEDTRTFN